MAFLISVTENALVLIYTHPPAAMETEITEKLFPFVSLLAVFRHKLLLRISPLNLETLIFFQGYTRFSALVEHSRCWHNASLEGTGFGFRLSVVTWALPQV